MIFLKPLTGLIVKGFASLLYIILLFLLTKVLRIVPLMEDSTTNLQPVVLSAQHQVLF